MPITSQNKADIKRQVNDIATTLSDISLKISNRKLVYNINDIDQVF